MKAVGKGGSFRKVIRGEQAVALRTVSTQGREP